MALDVEGLYRSYGPMVLRRCQKMLRDEDEAMDAMQDVFVQIVRRKDILEDRGLSSLLYRTATNTCLNKIRSAKRRPKDPATDMLSQIAAASDAVDQAEARSVLGRLFGAEAESTGTIAVLHLHDGLTLEETANAVGMSVSGVRKRLRKLKSNLGTLEASP
ncbi:MAG: sigma-70 family RNA polymerase sigma factor [Myxococcota bacterium]